MTKKMWLLTACAASMFASSAVAQQEPPPLPAACTDSNGTANAEGNRTCIEYLRDQLTATNNLAIQLSNQLRQLNGGEPDARRPAPTDEDPDATEGAGIVGANSDIANEARDNSFANKDLIVINQGDIAENSSAIFRTDADGKQVNRIQENAGNILLNKGAIATERTRNNNQDVDINTNAGNIATNRDGITANTTRSTENREALNRVIPALEATARQVYGNDVVDDDEVVIVNGVATKNGTPVVSRIDQNRFDTDQNTDMIAYLKDREQELSSAITNINTQIGDIYHDLEKHARGIAIATAMPDAYLMPGEKAMIAGNIGGFGGTSAIAIAGAVRVSKRLSFNAGIGADTRFKDVGWKAGGHIGF